MNQGNVTTRRKPTKQACGLCGKDPAAGFASIDGVRYCHGDDDAEPTCYMRASRTAHGGNWTLLDETRMS